MGVGVSSILKRIGFGSRQGLYNYFKKLQEQSGNKTSKLALNIKSKMPLHFKITYAKKKIKEFYKKQDGKVYISFSGGKDSTVLLHLVRSIYKDVEAVFCNTTNEYQEILEFVKNTPNVTWLNPKMSFNSIIKEYGFPLVSKKVARAISDLKNPTPRNVNSRKMYLEGIGSKGQNIPSRKLPKKWYYLIDEPYNLTLKCCDILKKEPFKRYEKITDKKPYIGTSAFEGETRVQNYLKHGCNIYNTKDAKSRPLSIFSEKDIWAYIKHFKLDVASIYHPKYLDNTLVSGEKRTGCAYCAFGAHLEDKNNNRFTRLQQRKPKQFKKMMALENNGVSYGSVLKSLGVLKERLIHL